MAYMQSINRSPTADSLEATLISALSDLLEHGETDVRLAECVRELGTLLGCQDNFWRYSSVAALHVASTYAPMRYLLWSQRSARRNLCTEDSLRAAAIAVEETFWRLAWTVNDGAALFGAEQDQVLRALLMATDDNELLVRPDVDSFVTRSIDWTRSTSEVVPRAYVALRDYLWAHSIGGEDDAATDAEVRTWLGVVNVPDIEQATAVARRLARHYSSNWLFPESPQTRRWTPRIARNHTRVEIFLVGGAKPPIGTIQKTA